jgi:enolase
MQIQRVDARVCFNGRGDPGVEADVWVEGKLGRALSPAGASTGRSEAVPFADGDPQKSVALVKTYSSKLVGIEASDAAAVTAVLREVDGTLNYSRIGGSAAYSISVATAEAEANARGVPLCRVIDPRCSTIPFPLGNALGGGKHASELSPSIQEILVSPVGATNILEAVKLNIEVSRSLGKRLGSVSKYPVGRGDEGAWSPGLEDGAAIRAVSEAAQGVQDDSGRNIRLGIDFASGSLYDEETETYYYRASKKRLKRDGQIAFVAELKDKFDLFYLEDPLHEEDFEGFASLRALLHGALVVGDDLYATSKRRLVRGAKLRSTNGVIVKVNQVGTLGEAREFSDAAREAKNTLIASHRSGDNEGAHLAHVALGFGCGLIKCGITGGERTAKLNELIRMSEKLGIDLGRLEI